LLIDEMIVFDYCFQNLDKRGRKLHSSTDGHWTIDSIAQALETPTRRIYDILGVLVALDMVSFVIDSCVLHLDAVMKVGSESAGRLVWRGDDAVMKTLGVIQVVKSSNLSYIFTIAQQFVKCLQ
jgi:hypothetical protein